jgi:putative aldouronate transport system permease protein
MKSNYVQDKIISISSYIYLSVFAIACVIPFFTMFSGSITGEKYLQIHGYSLLPHDFSLKAYGYLFSGKSSVGQSYVITIIVTLLGTAFSMLITSMMAYSLSRKEMKYKNSVAFIIFFTILFNGGLVPWYIVTTKYLHLHDSIWALILPYSVNAWNMFLLRNFFATIDDSMLESARIDGASEYRILFMIVLPLVLPGVMTVGLFYALQYWNDWWLALMLINDQKLYPLQYLLRMILSSMDYISSGGVGSAYAASAIPSESIKMATTIITIGPIIFIYPFIQKYFIKGLMVGGGKG